MQTVIKAVIIDDELSNRNNLKNLLNDNCPDVKVVGEADSVQSSLALLGDPHSQPDVAFLDISLPDGLVFQMINRLEEVNFDIIFVTGFDRYAIKACEYACIGYILKPIDSDLLVEAVNRIKIGKNQKTNQRLEVFTQSYQQPTKPFEKITVTALDGLYFLRLKDIMRMEGEDNYTHIFSTNGQKITASKTIKSYDELLTDMGFYRIHKKYLVNLDYIQKYVKGDNAYVVMNDGQKLSVSRRKRSIFTEILKKFQDDSAQ